MFLNAIFVVNGIRIQSLQKMHQHQKHSNIARKLNNNFAPNEVAILGTKCSTIRNLVYEIAKQLSQYNMAYFDASHAKDVASNFLSEYTFHHDGNLQLHTRATINPYEQRIQFYHHDFVFINGNHYQGATQIVILDSEKEASIKKRMHQLTDIPFVIKRTNDAPFFDCLIEKFPQIKKIPCYGIEEVHAITNHIKKLIDKRIAPVKGLVLTGGKSTRMGKDKSTLNYYGKPQKKYVQELLETCSLETFLSVRENSTSLDTSKEITDTFLNLGPFGGICSAFQKNPNSAWLVIATDIPFVNKEIIELLLKHRDTSKVATTIKGKGKEFPEPLITIYEPKAYGKLLQYLAQGYSCPRKMLINSAIKVIEVDNHFIRNINTPEEFEAASKEIQKRL